MIDLAASSRPTYCCYTTLRKINLMLTSSNKTVCYHSVHVRQSSYCSAELRRSFLQTCGLRIALILIQLTIKYGPWCRIECIKIRCQFETWPTWGSTWLTLVAKHCGTVVLMSGVRDFRHVWMKSEVSGTHAVIFRLKLTSADRLCV